MKSQWTLIFTCAVVVALSFSAAFLDGAHTAYEAAAAEGR